MQMELNVGDYLGRTMVQKVLCAKALNKVCNALNKVLNAQRSDWDLCIHAILWADKTTCKKLTRQTPFRPSVMPM